MRSGIIADAGQIETPFLEIAVYLWLWRVRSLLLVYCHRSHRAPRYHHRDHRSNVRRNPNSCHWSYDCISPVSEFVHFFLGNNSLSADRWWHRSTSLHSTFLHSWNQIHRTTGHSAVPKTEICSGHFAFLVISISKGFDSPLYLPCPQFLKWMWSRRPFPSLENAPYSWRRVAIRKIWHVMCNWSVYMMSSVWLEPFLARESVCIVRQCTYKYI